MSFIGTQPGYAYNTITKDTFNGDNSTVAFTLSVPATTNGVEVFVENVQQEPTTAYSVSGSTLTFTSAPPTGTGNIYVVHRNPTVQTLIPPSDIAVNVASITTTGSATIGDGLTVDNDGATVATFDRATSDGTITDLQKDGSSVGSIGVEGGDLIIESAQANHAGLRFAGGSVLPRYNGSLADNAVDLGQVSTNYRWKDLYLSGGVYVGGTGAANYLDDYEEGTWTPTISNGGFSGFSEGGVYTKVGRKVTVILEASLQGTANSGTFAITGLPFAEGLGRFSAGSMYAQFYNSEGTELVTASVVASSSEIKFIKWGSEAIGTDFSAGYFALNITYFTS